MADLNARIKPKKSSTAGEVPQAADLEVAEIAVNTADGKLFVKHTDNSIKEISGSGGGSGAVDSVNGETGAVSLGIQDMDDFALTSATGSLTFSSKLSGAPGTTDTLDDEWQVLDASSGSFFIYLPKNSTTELLVGGTEVRIQTSTGFDFTATVDNNNTSATLVHALRWQDPHPTELTQLDSAAVGTSLTITSAALQGDVEIPLAEGDILQWDNTDQKFKPAQRAVEINDLTDVDTTGTADGQVLTWVDTNSQWEPATPSASGGAVDSVNGQTGVVELDIEDMENVGLAVVAGDPDFSSTPLLLHFDGAQGGATFTNDGNADLGTPTVVGAITDQAQVKFGTASGKFTGSDYIDFPNSSAFHLGTGDFTIETWFYTTDASVLQAFVAFGDYSAGTTNRSFQVFYSPANGISFFGSPDGSTNSNKFFAWTATANTWYHIAVARESGTFRAFVDGVQVGVDETYTVDLYPATVGELEIGAYDQGSIGVEGYMDDTRITVGVARYTSNFTPPTSAFLGVPSFAPPADGQVLTWVDASNQWEPAQLPAGGGGAVDSVNGETGVVSLGIQDMDDYGLSPTTQPPGYNWDDYLNSNLAWDYAASGKYKLSTSSVEDKDWFLIACSFDGSNVDRDSDWATIEVGDLITLSEDGTVWHTFEVASVSRYDSDNSSSYVKPVYNLGLNEISADIPDLATWTSGFYTDPLHRWAGFLPLADGDHLQWVQAQQKFMPVQLPTGSPSTATSWSVTADGTSNYVFAGDGFAGTETDPVLYVVRGQTYEITNSMGAHPFQIQSTSGIGGTAYSDGITNNAVSDGTLTWEVRLDAPAQLYYQCTAHADMGGTIQVLENSAGGGGAVDSVNGQTGVVSIGIQDANDFGYAQSTESLTLDTKVPYPVSADGSYSAGYSPALSGDYIGYYNGGSDLAFFQTLQVGDNVRVTFGSGEVLTTTVKFADQLNGQTENLMILNGGSLSGVTVSGSMVFEKLDGAGSAPLQDGQVLTWVDANSQWEPREYISKATLKTEVAAATDFADFQARIAAL